ncbi:hypothetical protein TRICHSKD4_1040 [Roseibium sp. TrichSKD4]|uniref:hypothetical protein n=1 Tax=Roseibium sp. TrichSKD4 TaxID=744980 RepID=UPI0001E56397|nr:hypothetical protein [Roseibium sp. TrichSKD4]EFO33921.1 hypothetical protein TRICHSKD4_1040 [Roseibium sp. TrichSKD4]
MTNSKAERQLNEDCAAHIRAYWARRGITVNLEIVPAEIDRERTNGVTVLAIRSNIRFTMPTRQSGAGGSR